MNQDRPNIIVILTDDQGAWAMGCAGNTELRTPNLDRLAAEGTRFENFFCSSPVCSPARASILTGRIPSAHGVLDWLRAGNSTCEPENGGKLVEYLAGIDGYTDHVARAGYVCGMSGKWHLGDCHHAQKSYTFWKAHARAGGDYMKAPMVKNESEIYYEDRYITDVITDNALEFMERVTAGADAGSPSGAAPGNSSAAQSGRAERPSPPGGRQQAPFCLSVNYTAPHSPWERENHPAELWDDFYHNCPFESVPDEGPHPYKGRTDFFDSPERRREKLAGYFAAVTAMDAGVGRIIDWLEKRGLAEDTLVLFTSDNGMNMGHHGICGKGNGTWPINMYDTSVKVPMIAWQPGTVAAGRVVDGLYNHYDIFPTILEWAGVPGPVSGRTAGAAAGPASGRAAGAASADASAAGPAFLPGRSLAKILRGEKSGDGEDRPIVIYDPARAYSEFGPTRMIRTKEAKYVHRYPGGPHEYYDLVTDPDERVNQFENVEYHDAIAQMRAGLGEWFERYADPALDGSTKAVSGHGQLDLAILDQQGDVPFAQLWMKSWW